MIDLHFKKTGEGRPMVILHGLLGSLDNWQTLARMFGEKHTVYTVDQRNHGQSPHLANMSYELMADDLRDFLHQNHIRHPVLVGHSMGGKTVMRFSLKYPEQVGSMIIVDMSPRAYPVHHDKILNALSRVDFDIMKSRKEVEEFLWMELKDRGIVFFLSKNIYWKNRDRLGFRFNLEGIRDAIGALSSWPESEMVYPKECLFIRGGNSNYISDDDAELFRQFPLAALRTITGAGHWVHAEQQQAFFEAVSQYLV